MKGTAVTSDVVFSMLMTSLPVGGMITRIAWGARCGASSSPTTCPVPSMLDCPSGTELIPARMISAM